jgi:hypothetical protein
MNKTLKKRLCWNCEGNVALNEETCPFSGVSVVPAFLEGAGAEFSPPYSTAHEDDGAIPKSPFDIQDETTDSENREEQKQVNETEPAIDEFKQVLISVALLLTGSVFFLFSMALALFSQDGILTLQWEGDYWYIYTILALPLLFFGWRFLMKLDR